MIAVHDGVDLWQAVSDSLAECSARVAEMAALGRELAELERDYRVARRTETLWERTKGTPVSVIDALVEGKPAVSSARMARDCKQAEYDACREAALLAKKKADICEKQLEREWSDAKRDAA